MGYSSEIDKGEACCYNVDGGDDNIDPDVAFAYIDQKLRNVLGSSLKDFEGLVLAENLGPKFGEYGSFLPAYQRAPSIPSQSKTLQKNCSSQRSPVGGLSQHVPASSNIKPQTVLSDVHSSHNSRKPCGDVVHGESYVASTHSSKKILSENEIAVKLSNKIKKGPLKIRIKMGSESDSMKWKTAAICSGLGLEDTSSSSSSSLGNSPETGEDALISRDMEENSPTSMLEVMTSFPISEGFLISPLSDSLLSLVRNNGHEMGMNPVPILRGGEEHSSTLVEKPASLPWEAKLNKKNCELKIKRGRMGDIRLGDESNITSVKEKTETSLWDGKKRQSNDSKPTSLANSSCDAEGSVKVVVGEPDICRPTGRDSIKGNSYIADFVKEDSLESIAGQGSGKCKRIKINRSSEKVGDNREVKSSVGALMHLRNNGKGEADQISASSQARLNVSQPVEESKLIARPKQKLQKSLFHEQSEIKLASKGEKTSDEGKKKRKGISGSSKLAVIGIAESSKGRHGAVPKNKEAASSVDQIGSRVHNSMSEEPISKVQKIRHEMDTTSKDLESQMEKRKVAGYRTKVAGYAKAELDKPKGRSTARGTDDQLMSGVTVKNGLQRDLHGTEKGLTSDVAPAATAPVLIAEDWVCCDRCEKWRLLPYGTKLEHLPEKWLCSMLNWLPGMNRCDISEEETTKALHSLYQPLPTQDQNTNQAKRNDSACQSTSGSVQHRDQNHQKINSSGVSIPRKKKYILKDMPKTGNTSNHVQILDVAKTKMQDSLKSMSSSDMNQTLKESKLVKKSHDLTVGSTKIKMKNKEGNQHGSGVVKKTKIQSVQHADIYQNTDTDTGNLSHSSSAGMSYKERQRVAHNHNDCSSEEPKAYGNMRLLISSKDQPQLSSNGFDASTHKKGCISSNKRKLKDLQIDQGNHIQDKNVFTKEESSESGIRENKKLKAMRIERVDKNTDIGKIEAIDGLRCDIGSDSMIVSSFSKVSGSLKAKVSCEVKSSPVESVSSSLLKTAKTDKPPSAEEDTAEKDSSAHCDLPAMPKPTQFAGGQVVGESNRSRALRKLELLADSHDVLASYNFNACAGNKTSSSGRSFKIPDTHLENYGADKADKDCRYAGDLGDKDVFHDENRKRRKQQSSKGLLTENDSSLLTRNKNCTSDFEKDKMKTSDPTLRAEHKPRMGSQKEGISVGPELGFLQIAISEAQPVSGSTNKTHYSSAHLSPIKHAAIELDGLNPFIKDSLNQTVADVLKEAMFLRDKADHLKCSGFGFESNETYFQAALRFLYGASIFETCNGDIGKQEMSEMQMYMTAAKLCENCALEFENRQEMAAAALAFKGSEVAYMRVVYCKNSNMTKDWHEFNKTLQMAHKGESPSSSASDVDNSNNPATADKDHISKTAGSYCSENHALISRNRPYYAQLLDFTQDVSSAMEASRKSQVAFAAANLNLHEAQKQECVKKVKRVIDFSFQDVKGLVSLIEHAQKALSCLSFNGSKD